MRRYVGNRYLYGLAILICTTFLSGCVLQQYLAQSNVLNIARMSPQHHGLPDMILGYRIVAMQTSETTACIPDNSVRLTLQVDTNNPDAMLQIDVNAVLEELRRINTDSSIRWQLELIQSDNNISATEIAANLKTWNATMADGCVTFHMPTSGGSVEILATASP